MAVIGNTIMLKVFITVLKSVSPILLSEIQSLIEHLRVAAQQSANPWDDILVEFLEQLVTNLATRDI